LVPGEYEIHFLDVGQGSSSVILLPDRRTGKRSAIVIDCGMGADVILRVLKRFAAEIAALILTHNHRDYVGGAQRIIRDYLRADALHEVWLLHDTSPHFQKLVELLFEEAKKKGDKDLEWMMRLERRKRPEAIAEKSEFELEVLAPNLAENLRADKEKNPNLTSGVLRLRCHGQVILFTGDSTSSCWKRIQKDEGRIECEAVTAPHHGGCMEDGDPEDEAIERFFNEAVKAKHAIFSVGTANTHDHPRERAPEAARRSGANVFCTQITPKCFRDLDVPEEARRVTVRPTRFAQSVSHRKRTDAGKSTSIACAGTISLNISADSASWGRRPGDPDPLCGFDTFTEYCEVRTQVEGLPNCRPFCRRAI